MIASIIFGGISLIFILFHLAFSDAVNGAIRCVSISQVLSGKNYFINIYHNNLSFANRGGTRICPTGRLGSPTGGLDNRTEGIFLCTITKFSVKNSLTDTKYFPDRRVTLPDEGATIPGTPLVSPLFAEHAFLASCWQLRMHNNDRLLRIR